MGKADGGYYPLVKSNSNDGKNWISMPWTIVGGMIAYRKSWFEEVGSPEFPDTWEKYREVGAKLKAKGRPLGQTLGHTFGDAPTFTYPYLWSWGGKEVEADGKVVINSKETLESVKFMTGFWKEAHDEGGLAWDDTNNNRAFLSQTIAATLNGASIYIESLRNPDKYITEKGAKLNTDILHAALPKGPAGQFSMHTYFSHALPKYSKNEKAAKDLLKWVHSKDVYEKWFVSQKGFATPPAADWEKHKVWDAWVARPATLVPRTPRQPRCPPSTSSPTCTRRPSKARRPKRPSSGPRASSRRSTCRTLSLIPLPPRGERESGNRAKKDHEWRSRLSRPRWAKPLSRDASGCSRTSAGSLSS